MERPFRRYEPFRQGNQALGGFGAPGAAGAPGAFGAGALGAAGAGGAPGPEEPAALFSFIGGNFAPHSEHVFAVTGWLAPQEGHSLVLGPAASAASISACGGL